MKLPSNRRLGLTLSAGLLVLGLSPLWKNGGVRSLPLAAAILILVMALVFVWYGIRFVQFGWNQTSELAELPMPWIFVAWPLAGLTWVLFLGERFLVHLRQLFAKAEAAR